MDLICPDCCSVRHSFSDRGSLILNSSDFENHSWVCGICGYTLDTGISLGVDLNHLAFIRREPRWLDIGLMEVYKGCEKCADIKRVFMPPILSHVIECTRGGCWISLSLKTVKPYLNSIDVVEYVTKTYVHPCGAWRTKGGGLMYSDLYRLLMDVEDESVRQHVIDNCRPNSPE